MQQQLQHAAPSLQAQVAAPSEPQDAADCIVAVLADGEPSAEDQGLTFDEALVKYVGEFGRGQWVAYIAGSLLSVPNAVLILLLVFSLGSPIADRAWACTADADAECHALLAGTTPDSRALDAAGLTAAFCAMDPGRWRWTEPGLKLVSQFSLVCASAWKQQVANSFFFLGYLIGSGLFGSLSDTVGRKRSAFGASALAAVFTAAAIGASSSYWLLLSLRLLTGIGVAGQALGSYLLATEMLGPTWRGVAGICTQLFFIAGEFTLVIISLALPSWRGQFAAGAVLTVVSLGLWPLVPESGRWLQVQGRTEEALQVLTTLARANGSRPPDEPLAKPPPPPTAASDIDASGEAPRQRARGTGLRAALSDAHIARRFSILAYSFLVMCMAYYGISFALGGLSGSLVVSFSIAALAELPSYLLAAWAIERIGRHNTMAAGMLLGGVACVACAVTPPGAGQTALAAVGKFGIAGSFGIASIYTSELFPTMIRSAVLGIENQAARLGGIVAPFIVMAGASSSGGNLVPFATFGAASVLAGLLIFTLPETLGVPLPETLQDMDVIASVFTHKTWRTGGLKAATKSIFKTHVAVAKPRPRPSLQQASPPALAGIPETGGSPVTPSPAGVAARQALQRGGGSREALLPAAHHGSSGGGA